MKLENIVTKLKSLIDKNTSDIATQTARIDKLSTVEVRKLRVTAASKSGAYTTITATVPDGYTFLCWTGVASINFIGSPYINDCSAKTARIFDTHGATADNFYYDAFYLISRTV